MARPLPTPVDDPGSLEVRIGPMRRRHLRGVIRIEQQVYPRPWTFGLFLSEIGQRTTRLYLVARVGTEVVGYGGLFRAVDDGHITTVAVDPAWHRHGIATRMLVAPREDALVMWANDVDTPAYAERLATIERDIPGTTVVEGGWL
jgi:ribosomal-protein-alanine N-acetyltransferase